MAAEDLIYYHPSAPHESAAFHHRQDEYVSIPYQQTNCVYYVPSGHVDNSHWCEMPQGSPPSYYTEVLMSSPSRSPIIPSFEDRLIADCHRYLLTDEQLAKNCYPRVTKRGISIASSMYSAGVPVFAAHNDLNRHCARCTLPFVLGVTEASCWADGRYYPKHVTVTMPDSARAEFRCSPKPGARSSQYIRKILALDCEMVYTEDGLALGRVTVVDVDGNLLMNQVVRPRSRIIDCNFKYSGLRMMDLLNGYDMRDVHEELFSLMNSDTILVGHSLESDLRALRLIHNRVIDTAIMYGQVLPSGIVVKQKLKELMLTKLDVLIQNGDCGHDSIEDATAAMDLLVDKLYRQQYSPLTKSRS